MVNKEEVKSISERIKKEDGFGKIYELLFEMKEKLKDFDRKELDAGEIEVVSAGNFILIVVKLQTFYYQWEEKKQSPLINN